MGAGRALALICAFASPRAALGQGSATASKAGTAKSTTATPKKHSTTAAMGTRSSTSSPSKSATKPHPASHPAANEHSKTSTAAAAHRSKSKYASSRKGGKRKIARGQQKIDPERAQAIQEALIREHYMSGEAAGTWNQSSEDAMRRYQGRFLREALEQGGWNVSETARRIGVARSHLNDLIRVHGLSRGPRK